MKASCIVLAGMAALGACLSACSSPPEESTSTVQQRIQNGILVSDTDSISRPTVYVFASGASRGSGVLLKSNVVLLSAHQVMGLRADQLSVQRGNVDVALAAQVAGVVVHPSYVPRSGTREPAGVDLALLFLKTTLFPSLNGDVANIADPIPATVRCESAFYHGPLTDIARQTGNQAFFASLPATLGADLGYINTEPNVPFQQFLSRGDSGSPCYPQVGDKLAGIVSGGNPLAANLQDRTGRLVDVRFERSWILGSAVTDTEASVTFDWDLDTKPDVVRLTRRNGKLDLQLTGSKAGTVVRVPLELANVPSQVASIGLGNFKGSSPSLALVGDGNLRLVELSSPSETPLGSGYRSVAPRALDANTSVDLIAFRTDGGTDVFLGGQAGLSKKPQASALLLPLNADALVDAVMLDGKALTTASSNPLTPFSTVTIPFTKAGVPTLTSAPFRPLSAPHTGIHDLVALENGEVAYCLASLAAAFDHCEWLHLPSTSAGKRAISVRVVDFDHDGWSDLAVGLDDGTMKYYPGGTSSGLTETTALTLPRVQGDVNLDGCVDAADWEVFVESYGYSTESVADLRADFDADGWVDDLDYLVLLQTWQTGPLCN